MLENKIKKIPEPRIINTDQDEETGYIQILSGPPESITMRSGLVVLQPGSSVGVHNTENFEELIVILEGQATIQVTGREMVIVEEDNAFYCPPNTEHNVLNAGTEPLRYLYVVAEVKPRTHS
jgi:mannose-6-phosphate isomerase-like protein (cupin superfamily)